MDIPLQYYVSYHKWVIFFFGYPTISETFLSKISSFFLSIAINFFSFHSSTLPFFILYSINFSYLNMKSLNSCPKEVARLWQDGGRNSITNLYWYFNILHVLTFQISMSTHKHIRTRFIHTSFFFQSSILGRTSLQSISLINQPLVHN